MVGDAPSGDSPASGEHADACRRCGTRLEAGRSYCHRCGLELNPPIDLPWWSGFGLAWAVIAGGLLVFSGWSASIGSIVVFAVLGMIGALVLSPLIGRVTWRFKDAAYRDEQSRRRQIEDAWRASICDRCRARDVAGEPFCPQCGNKLRKGSLTRGEEATRRHIERDWQARQREQIKDLEAINRDLKRMGPEQKAAFRARMQSKFAEEEERRYRG